VKSETEIQQLLDSNYKTLEKELGIQIRNGQAPGAVKATLRWVLS
jgi:hypothetical protein